MFVFKKRKPNLLPESDLDRIFQNLKIYKSLTYRDVFSINSSLTPSLIIFNSNRSLSKLNRIFIFLSLNTACETLIGQPVLREFFLTFGKHLKQKNRVQLSHFTDDKNIFLDGIKFNYSYLIKELGLYLKTPKFYCSLSASLYCRSSDNLKLNYYLNERIRHPINITLHYPTLNIFNSKLIIKY